LAAAVGDLLDELQIDRPHVAGNSLGAGSRWSSRGSDRCHHWLCWPLRDCGDAGRRCTAWPPCGSPGGRAGMHRECCPGSSSIAWVGSWFSARVTADPRG
jgi:hypothetical protein